MSPAMKRIADALDHAKCRWHAEPDVMTEGDVAIYVEDRCAYVALPSQPGLYCVDVDGDGCVGVLEFDDACAFLVTGYSPRIDR